MNRNVDVLPVVKSIVKWLVYRALPPGTKRKRKDGVYEKQSSGKWVKVKEEKKKKAEEEKKYTKKINIQTEEEVKKWQEKGIVPENWFVSGRLFGKEESGMLQATNNWDIAEGYAGDDGTIVMFGANKNSQVMDMTNAENRKQVVTDLFRDYEKGILTPELDDIIEVAIHDYGQEEVMQKIENELFPTDIVDSAEMYDSQSFVMWLYESYYPDMIYFGKNASIALNTENLDTIRINV